MANNQSFKVKNGILAQRYLQTAGTETTGTVGYYLTGASYDNKSLSVTSQATLPIGSAIKSDGTNYYIIDNVTDNVFQYDLSTAWDISTATYSSKSFSVSSQTTSPVALAISADGTKMYTGNTGTVYQYTLSTPWDISTASYASKSYTNGTNHTNLRGIFFKPDGTKVYIGDIGGTPKDVFQYSLSTAWDISTASYDSKTLVVTATVGEFGEFDFNSDGTKLFFQSLDNDAVYQYSLSTAYDISTGVYDSVSFSTGSQDATSRGFVFGNSGTKFYLVGGTNKTIYQYSTTSYTQTLDLSTGTYFSFTPSGATTVSFTNPPASGVAIAFALEIIGNGSAITWPASVKWHKSIAPTVTSTKELYTFITVDGGTTYFGKQAATGIA